MVLFFLPFLTVPSEPSLKQREMLSFTPSLPDTDRCFLSLSCLPSSRTLFKQPK